MPPNFTRWLSQLTSPKPRPGRHLLELLVHMVAERRRRRKDSLRKRCIPSTLICHLPRGAFPNEPDLAVHTEVGVYACRTRRPIGEGGCEWVCFVPASPSHPHGLTLRIWLAVSGVRKAFPCKFQSGSVKCNWLPFFSASTRDSRLVRELFKPETIPGLVSWQMQGLIITRAHCFAGGRESF